MRIPATLFLNHRRCIANTQKDKQVHPDFREQSPKTCRNCGEPIKLKHVLRAKQGNHRPPDKCYPCICLKKNKKSPRQRKIELAKQRKQQRERNKPP